MPNQSLCEIVVLLDRSGSMAAIQSDMVGGFKSYIEAQKKEPGDCVVTLVQFDSDGIDTVMEAKPIREVDGMTLDPRGCTPLLDALGKTIQSVGKRLAALPEDRRPGKVLFLIITDGQENASTEFKKDQIRAMIEEQTKTWKWTFVYLGANVDAFNEAASLGIDLKSSAGYAPTPGAVAAVFGNLALNTSSLRSGGGFTYSDSQRQSQS